MNPKEIVELEIKANELRIQVLKMLKTANSGHAAGSLGLADIFSYLYNGFLNYDAREPEWIGRDYLLVSNGHICPIWYAALAAAEFFPEKELETLRKFGSRLQGHPSFGILPGIENSSGPLGHGISHAVGVAIGLNISHLENKVICITSDGEHQEGAIWETANVAAKYGLSNLTFVLDQNGIQIDGFVKDIMPQADLGKIYTEIGWHVMTIDGHNFSQIEQAFKDEQNLDLGKPKLIIANTVAGKGVSEIEDKWEYHDWRGDSSVADRGIAELTARNAELSSEQNNHVE